MGAFQKRNIKKKINKCTFINNDKTFQSITKFVNTLWIRISRYDASSTNYMADTCHINHRNISTLNKETSTELSQVFSMICIVQQESFVLFAFV